MYIDSNLVLCGVEFCLMENKEMHIVGSLLWCDFSPKGILRNKLVYRKHVLK